MTNTTHFGIPKPVADADVSIADEFYRLQEAWDTADAAMKAILDNANGRAPADHTQAMSTITGLPEALEGKMPASTTFKFDDLTDVSGAEAAPSGYVMVKSPTGWVPSSPAAAIGDHEHQTSDIVGLDDALAARPDRDEMTEALDLLDAEIMKRGVPLGMIVHSAVPLEDYGFLLADGAPCTPVWPDLRAALIAAGSPFGNNGTDPLLPDEVTASRFRRAANEDLPVGTTQEDQIQNITGTWGNVILRNSSDVSGVFGTTADGPANATGASGASGTGRGLSFDASRVVRAGDETRPKSIAYLPYIKAFGAITIEGMADLSALFAALATEIEAVTGTDNTKLMTALRVRQACAAYNRWRTISFDELNAESSWVVTDLGDFKFLRLEGFLVSSVSANSLFRVSSDNGLTWKQGATDYWAIYDGTATASASNGATQNNYGYVCIASVGAGFPQTFQHFFSRWNVAGEKHVLSSAGNLNGSGNNTHYSWLTRMMAGAAVAANALQVIVSSGNFSGQLHLEGLS